MLHVDWRRLLRLAGVLALAAPVLGCTHKYLDTHLYADRRDSVSFAAGDAVAANKVAQMVDPWPAESANRNIAYDGQRMQRAVERYRANRTTPLATTNTSSAAFVPVLAPATAGPGGPTQ